MSTGGSWRSSLPCGDFHFHTPLLESFIFWRDDPSLMQTPESKGKRPHAPRATKLSCWDGAAMRPESEACRGLCASTTFVLARAVPRGATDLSAVRNLSETEKAWLAGVIDGEGSIGIYRSVDGRRVQIQVANTHRGFIDRVRAVVGCGSICPREPRGLHKGRKTVYHYTCKGSERGLKILAQVLPYLIVKREKAEAIIQELRTHPFGRWAAAAPEARKRMSDLTRRSWQDPLTRERRITGLKAYYASRRGASK